MSFTLRDYQLKIVDTAREAMRQGCKALLITSPTGSGKTNLTAHMLKTSSEKGIRSAFLVHRRELVRQTMRTFSGIGVNFGVIANGWQENPRALVQIASVQTYARRYNRFAPPGLVVWDEAHHNAAKTWADLHRKMPGAFHIGLTATPERLDGRGLREYFFQIIEGPSVRWLIENNFLARYRLFAPPAPDLNGLHARAGDYVKSELNARVDKPTITGDAIKHYLKYAAGKRFVVFASSVDHAKHITEQFKAAGISAEEIDGDTPITLRDLAIEKFQRNDLLGLVNVDLFGEGFDVPGIECIIGLRPTLSLALWRQQVGRALRPSEGKTAAIILDHAGNTLRHGLPDDDIEWSLDGAKARKKASEDDGPGLAVRICQNCFAAQPRGSARCIVCGQVFIAEAKRVEFVDGELQEIDHEAMRKKRFREQGMATTEAQLVELGRARGYRRPELWARHLLRVRNEREALRRARV